MLVTNMTKDYSLLVWEQPPTTAKMLRLARKLCPWDKMFFESKHPCLVHCAGLCPTPEHSSGLSGLSHDLYSHLGLHQWNVRSQEQDSQNRDFKESVSDGQGKCQKKTV